LFGNQSKEEFLVTQGVTYYPVAQYIASELPKDSKILMVGETRGYYYERAYILSTNIYNLNGIALREFIVGSQTVEEVVQKLHRMGITHLLLNVSEMKRVLRMEQQNLQRDSYFDFQTEKNREMFNTLFSPQYVRSLMSKYGVQLFEIL
jgi:hypothetical protein